MYTNQRKIVLKYYKMIYSDNNLANLVEFNFARKKAVIFYMKKKETG